MNGRREITDVEIKVPEGIFDPAVADEMKSYVKAMLKGKQILPRPDIKSEGVQWYNIGTDGTSPINKHLNLGTQGRVEFPFGIVTSLVKLHEFLLGNLSIQQLRNQRYHVTPGRSFRRKGTPTPAVNYKSIMLAYFLEDIRRDKDKQDLFINNELIPYGVVLVDEKRDIFTLKNYLVDYVDKVKYRFIVGCYVLAHYLVQTGQLNSELIKSIIDLNLVEGSELYDGITVHERHGKEEVPSEEEVDQFIPSPEETESNEEEKTFIPTQEVVETPSVVDQGHSLTDENTYSGSES